MGRIVIAPERAEVFTRSEVVTLAKDLRRELDALQDRCTTLMHAGEDYLPLWDESRGLFRAYRQLANLLGWQ